MNEYDNNKEVNGISGYDNNKLKVNGIEVTLGVSSDYIQNKMKRTENAFPELFPINKIMDSEVLTREDIIGQSYRKRKLKTDDTKLPEISVDMLERGKIKPKKPMSRTTRSFSTSQLIEEEITNMNNEEIEYELNDDGHSIRY